MKTFGQTDSVMKILDVVQVRVKSRFTGKFIYLEVLCVPIICSPLTKQKISTATQLFSSLRNLTLADFDYESSEFPIGLLIGLGYYHSFFSGKSFKTKGGPTAVETVLGWILSGPISSSNNSSHS